MRPGAGGGKSPPGGSRYRPQEREGPALPKAKWNRELHRLRKRVDAFAGAFLFYSEKGDAAMFRTLKEDLDAVMERDPAARSRLEVFFLYSGF